MDIVEHIHYVRHNDRCFILLKKNPQNTMVVIIVHIFQVKKLRFINAK